ncbi:MAG TPA: NAD(P)/FAD-dependent oxidoreductase, partial [Acidimicrobiales bacterium]|nr:NAD(P)/FAD-dependent oxidoreductase [Acidimicrobiales bacterium]
MRRDEDRNTPGTDATTKVVILGGGFAGLSCAAALQGHGLDVTLVDKHDYNTFQPLLYQVATAGLNPGDVTYPFRNLTRMYGVQRFRRGRATGVSTDPGKPGGVLETDAGPLPFDYLVVACGAATNFFGVAGAEENALAIYNVDDSLSVRKRLFANMEHAAAFGGANGELTVAVVGGGATGVEMAGALAELQDLALRTTFKELSGAGARVILVEQRDRLLGAFEESLAGYAERELRRRGVEMRLSTAVLEVGTDFVSVATDGQDEEKIPCGLVVWAAGVGPEGFAATLTVPKLRGRIVVDETLRVPGVPGVFAVGDAAAGLLVRSARAESTDGDRSLIPQLAQPAIQTGKHAALEILGELAGRQRRSFVYLDKGTMATIG